MKKITINITFILAISMLSSPHLMAHFGSKGPFGGSISCMAVRDTNVYIGTFSGGVFESTNSQLNTWRPRPVGLKSGNIHALAHTGSYLFAATDSGIYRLTGYIGNDRYWEKVSNGLPSYNVTSLIAIDSITLLAGLDGYGVYKTINNGARWDSSNTNMLHFEVNGFVKAGNRIIQISDGGLWASDDNGQTWFDYTDISTDDIDATAISYNSATDELLVYNTVGLYILPNASSTGTPAYVAAQANLPLTAIVKSITNDGSNWYIATDQGIFTSPTGTINWANQNTGIATNNTNAIVYLSTQSVLVTGTVGEGIYKTPSSSISWRAMNNGFNNIVTRSMITKDALLVIAATEKGVFRSSNLATSYQRINNGLTDSLNVNDLTFFGSTLIAATENKGVFISSDTGTTWIAYNTNLTNMTIRKVKASSSFVYLFDSNGEIFQSNLSSGWTSIQSGLPGGVNPSSMDFYNGNILLGTMGDGIYTRPEASGTWTQNNSGLSNLNVTSVTVNNQNKMFAGTDGNGVFVSDLSSINWTTTAALVNSFTTTMGLAGDYIQAMGYYYGYVFASVRGAVHASSDNGLTWIEGGTQFNMPSYADIYKLSFVTTRIFATTPNNCLYSNGLSELPNVLGVKEVADKSGINIYPNPSEGIFTLTYDNPSEKTVELLIYDELGNHVAKYNSPLQKISLNCSEGIYFMKLTTNKRIINQKLIIE